MEIIIEKDNGTYDAMNKGLFLSEMDSHILFLNSGDILKNKDCHLIIIDDVFTTGAHLKVAIEKISEIINLNTDKEYELLQAIAKAGTDYVIDAVITNRIRKGVNVNEILAKNDIQNIYDKAYIKQIINNKVLSFSGLFLATTQSNPDYNLDSGEFRALGL